MACDICGKTTLDLIPLRDIYQTDEIKLLCSDCGKIADDEKNRLHKWTSTLLTRMLKRNLEERRMTMGAYRDKP